MTGYDIREVLPEVFRIPVPLAGNPLKELNSYLFRGSREEKQRNLLVDTGFRTEGCKKALLKGLEQLGVSGRKGIYQPGGLPVYGRNIAGAPFGTIPGKRN